MRRGIGRAFQVASLFPTLTVEEALAAAVQAHQRREDRQAAVVSARPAASRAGEIMEMLKLTRVAGILSRNLSHGDQKLLDIGLALALDPKVLLLDEPTAGMGPEERWQMIETVQGLWRAVHMTLIFIEHDMDIVFKVAQTVRVLSYGTVLAEGTPDEIRRNPKVIEAYLGKSAGGCGMSGEPILKVDGIDVFYGASQILFGVSLDVERGQSLALLGRNGAGKSTTMKAIIGLAPPRRGTITVHGVAVHRRSADRIARGGIGFVPEDRQIFPEHSVEDNLLIGAKTAAPAAASTGPWRRSTTSFRSWRRCAGAWAAGCRAASSRC